MRGEVISLAPYSPRSFDTTSLSVSFYESPACTSQVVHLNNNYNKGLNNPLIIIYLFTYYATLSWILFPRKGAWKNMKYYKISCNETDLIMRIQLVMGDVSSENTVVHFVVLVLETIRDFRKDTVSEYIFPSLLNLSKNINRWSRYLPFDILRYLLDLYLCKSAYLKRTV